MAGCRYCRENTPDDLVSRSEEISRKGDFYPGMDVYISGRELCIECTPDTYEPSYMDAYIFIDYCPMCGRRLKGD